MIYLASESPRRQQLIRQITTDFIVYPTNVDEILDNSYHPAELALKNAQLKSRYAYSKVGGIVVGADTVVSLDGEVMGKPKDKQEAYKMLKILSGKSHTVVTGVYVTSNLGEFSEAVTSMVTFYELPHEVITKYIDTGNCFGKAGAYGIQDNDYLVKGLIGDKDNVIGLPVNTTKKLLNLAGYRG